MIYSDFLNWLSHQSAVTAIVSNRVYPDTLPQSPTFPAITFNQVSRVGVDGLEGSCGKARRRVQINCWATTKKGAWQLADAVRQTLNGFHTGTFADSIIGSVRLDNEVDIFDEESKIAGTYRVVQDYIIAHLEI